MGFHNGEPSCHQQGRGICSSEAVGTWLFTCKGSPARHGHLQRRGSQTHGCSHARARQHGMGLCYLDAVRRMAVHIQVLADIAWAFAAVRRVAVHMQGLANTAWAFAVARQSAHGCSHVRARQHGMGICSGEAARGMAVHMQGLASTAWALATLMQSDVWLFTCKGSPTRHGHLQ